MHWLSRTLSTIADWALPQRPTFQLVHEASSFSVAELVSPTRVSGAAGSGPWRAAISLLPYRAPLVRALILEAKFHGTTRAYDLLGEALGATLRQWAPEQDLTTPSTLIVVPVPLSAARYRERGYNQVDKVVRATRPLSGYTYAPHLLSRIRDGPSQTALSAAARAHNLTGAFAARSGIHRGYTYIVVDDVITTGATLRAACHALRRGGARRIYAVALARQARNATLGSTGDVAEWPKAPHC